MRDRSDTILDTTKLTAPRILVIMVVSGVILTAFHIYQATS